MAAISVSSGCSSNDPAAGPSLTGTQSDATTDGTTSDARTDTGADAHDAHDASDAADEHAHEHPDATTEDADADADVPDAPDAMALDPIPCTQGEFDAVASPTGGDFTAAGGVEIGFPNNGSVAQYTHRCIKVKVGDVVTFEGAFASHPLAPFGGDVPNPIPSQGVNPATGLSGLPELPVTMSTAGSYGFRCNIHRTSMNGAIQVVP